MFSREKLVKIRTVAIRRGVWYKTLSKAEQALVELTIRIVKKIRIVMTAIVLILFFWLTYSLLPFVRGIKQWSSMKKQRIKDLNISNHADPSMTRTFACNHEEQ